nr:hypothetical protein [Escherichia coli]WDZ04112.1 hypothetical protein [Escherichia coli]
MKEVFRKPPSFYILYQKPSNLIPPPAMFGKLKINSFYFPGAIFSY